PRVLRAWPAADPHPMVPGPPVESVRRGLHGPGVELPGLEDGFEDGTCGVVTHGTMEPASEAGTQLSHYASIANPLGSKRSAATAGSDVRLGVHRKGLGNDLAVVDDEGVGAQRNVAAHVPRDVGDVAVDTEASQREALHAAGRQRGQEGGEEFADFLL